MLPPYLFRFLLPCLLTVLRLRSLLCVQVLRIMGNVVPETVIAILAVRSSGSYILQGSWYLLQQLSCVQCKPHQQPSLAHVQAFMGCSKSAARGKSGVSDRGRLNCSWWPFLCCCITECISLNHLSESSLSSPPPSAFSSHSPFLFILFPIHLKIAATSNPLFSYMRVSPINSVSLLAEMHRIRHSAYYATIRNEWERPAYFNINFIGL